jgi:NTP pyrophosphatase (non-canonical NTP hydrolase)
MDKKHEELLNSLIEDLNLKSDDELYNELIDTGIVLDDLVPKGINMQNLIDRDAVLKDLYEYYKIPEDWDGLITGEAEEVLSIVENAESPTDMYNDLFDKAITKWGEAPQLVMMMEECAELTQAISKALRGKEDLSNIAEEIADVEIMLAQMKLIFSNSVEVENWKSAKIQRLKELLEKDE